MKHVYKAFLFFFIFSLLAITTNAQFTAGRLVVLQVGDGSAALGNTATPVFLKEFTTTGTAGVSLTIPTTGTTRLTQSGSATSEGQITLSADGQFINIAGYDAAATTAGIAATSSATVNRVINTVDAGGTVTRGASTTSLYSGNNFRSAVRSNNADFWGAGGTSGTFYFGTTATAASVQNATVVNGRVINIFNGNLYLSTSSSTAPSIPGVWAFAGTPFTSSTPTLFIGTGTGSSPYAFAINPAGNVAYIADDRATAAGGVQKWTLTGSTWSLAYTFSSGANIGTRGVIVDFSGSNPIVYAITTDNKLVRFTDAGSASAATVLATAPTNTAYRSVVFSPAAALIPTVNLSVSTNVGSEAAATAVTVTATASSPVSGNQTVSLSVSGTNITAGDYTLSNATITIPSGTTTGNVTFTVVDDVIVEATETAILTISSPSSGIMLGSPVTQNISIVDNDNSAPTIALDAATTSDFIDGAIASNPTSPFAISAVINDPTAPAQFLGINFIIADAETAASSLVVTAASDNQTVVPDANILISGTVANRKIKITPTAVGFANISVTVSDGVAQTTYILNYAASDVSNVPASTRFHTGTSDASTAVALDNNYMLVGDDENQGLRLYDRQNSGLPLKVFDFTSSLGLTDLSGGLPREVDIEASTRVGNRIYWLGSHSNSASGANRPNRRRLFATDITGTGAATTLSYVGRYDDLRTDLINWDVNDVHGLGANFFGLASSTAVGVIPEATDGSGFNIEGLVMAPDGTTGYICFRAPISPASNRTKALIVPVTNFTSLVTSNPTTGPAIFGTPIQLDLGGRGIREIKKNASGEYLIIAGPHDVATGTAPKDFRFYTWTGNAGDLPTLRTGNMNILNANGSFESIVDLPDPLTSISPIQLLVDNGDAIFYANGVIAKDLAQNNFKKFRSDTVVLGAAGTVLPLTLVQFEVKANANDAVVHWRTANETNLRFYEVQFSVDGKKINTLTIQSPAAGANEKNYVFTHFNASTVASKLYYRLKVTEKNGDVSYSSIALIRFDNKGLLITDVYPNPTKSFIQVVATNASGKAIRLRIIDLQGKTLLAKEITGSGSNTIDLHNLTNGVYIMEALLPDGNKQQFKFVKE